MMRSLIILVMLSVAVLAQDIYVANQIADTVTIFESANTTNVSTLSVGDQPHEIAMHPSGRWIYVTNRLDHNVSVLDGATRTEVDTDGNPANGVTRLAVGSYPHGIAVSGDGSTIVVTNGGSSSVSVVTTSPLQVVATITGLIIAPHMARFTPDGQEIWVTDIVGGNAYVLDATAMTQTPGSALTATYAIGGSPEGVAFTPDGSRALIVHGFNHFFMSVVERATGTITQVLVGQSPLRVEISPSGLTAWVANFSSNSISIVDLQTFTVSATIGGINTPVGLAFSPDGSRAFAAGFGGTVYVIDPVAQAVIGTVPAGSGADGLVHQPDVLTAEAALIPGSTGTVVIRRPQDFGLAYQAACAFGTTPGIPLGSRTIPLEPDGLFTWSLMTPAVFVGFSGTLDALGTAQTSLVVPPLPTLSGTPFFMAAVTFDQAAPNGVRTISPALPLQVQ